MKVNTLVAIMLFAWTMGNAQVKKWTLEECVTYAVDNNLSIAQFELDLDNARIDKSDAIGNLLPSLNVSSDLSENLGLSFNPTSQEPVSTQLSFTSNTTASVDLFDGLRNYRRLERAKINAIANQYQLDDLKDDIRLQVANAYLSVVSTKEQLKVSKAQYAVTEQDLNRTKELVESGVVPRGDQLELEATAASQEQQIVNGESLVIIARVNLAQLLQITDYENFDVVDEGFEVPPSEILNNSAKSIFAKAMEFRNDIKFSEKNVELAEKDLQIAKGAYFPTLSSFINYNARYSDQNLVQIGEDEFSVISLIDQLWLNDGLTYGFQLNVPIFNGWSSRNGVKRSEISLERSKLQFELDKLALEADIQQAYVDVNTFAKAYEAAQKTLEARRLAYEYARERYEVGLMNAFDFQQAQARLDDAEANVIQTKYDYIFRIKILEFYFGIPISLD